MFIRAQNERAIPQETVSCLVEIHIPRVSRMIFSHVYRYNHDAFLTIIENYKHIPRSQH